MFIRAFEHGQDTFLGMGVTKSLKHRDIIILGLLMEQPRYGYETKTTLDNSLSYLVNVNSGSLYYGIKRLQKEGLVEEVAIEKIGRRPERSVYQLTTAGRTTFIREVESQVFPLGRSFHPLELALFFIDLLDKREILRRLTMRQAALLEAGQFYQQLLLDAEPPLTRCQKLVVRHKLATIQADFKFIDDLFVELGSVEFVQLTAQDQAKVASFIHNYKKFVMSGLAASPQPTLPEP